MAVGAARMSMAAARAPARDMMKEEAAPRVSKKLERRSRAVVDDADDEDQGSALPDEAALEAFVFTSLRLRAPWEGADRGRLIPVDAMASYLEILGRTGLVVGGDARQALAEAAQRAESAAGRGAAARRVAAARRSHLVRLRVRGGRAGRCAVGWCISLSARHHRGAGLRRGLRGRPARGHQRLPRGHAAPHRQHAVPGWPRGGVRG
jgi:hypothetical protein